MFVALAPGDVAADHRVLLLVAVVVGPVECEVPKSGEVALNVVQERGVGGHIRELDIVGRGPVAHAAVFLGGNVRAEVVARPAQPVNAADRPGRLPRDLTTPCPRRSAATGTMCRR